MKISPAKNSSLYAWLQLIRLPNILTAVGDPLSGLFLAAAVRNTKPGLWAIIVVPLAVIALYVFGMVANDICDFKKDSRQRPERPLPAQRISLTAARAGAFLACLAGLTLALTLGRNGFVTAVMLVLLILHYNLGFKKHSLYGPVAMGLCRGFSFLLGASVFTWPLSTLVIAAMLTGYVAAVTYIATFENRGHRYGREAALPFMFVLGILLACVVAAWAHSTVFGRVAGMLVFVVSITLSGIVFRELTMRRAAPADIQRAVGILLRNLLLIQAGLLFIAPPLLATVCGILVLLMLYPANVMLGKKFYAT